MLWLGRGVFLRRKGESFRVLKMFVLVAEKSRGHYVYLPSKVHFAPREPIMYAMRTTYSHLATPVTASIQPIALKQLCCGEFEVPP